MQNTPIKTYVCSSLRLLPKKGINIKRPQVLPRNPPLDRGANRNSKMQTFANLSMCPQVKRTEHTLCSPINTAAGTHIRHTRRKRKTHIYLATSSQTGSGILIFARSTQRPSTRSRGLNIELPAGAKGRRAGVSPPLATPA